MKYITMIHLNFYSIQAQYNPFLRQELEFDLVTVDISEL